MNREFRVRDVRQPDPPSAGARNRPGATEPRRERDEEAAGRFPQRMSHGSRSQAEGS